MKCPFDLHIGFQRDDKGKAVLVNRAGANSPIRSSKLNEVLTLVSEAEWRFPDRPTIQGPVEFEGRTYWFCSEACREIFLAEPQKYKDGKTILDLALDGALPNDPDEFLRFMGIADPSLGGDLYAANGNGHRSR